MLLLLLFAVGVFSCDNHHSNSSEHVLSGSFNLPPSKDLDELKRHLMLRYLEIIKEVRDIKEVKDIKDINSVNDNPIVVFATRICDHCGKTISMEQTNTVRTCSSCGINYDLCEECQSRGIPQDSCPDKYGCNHHLKIK